MKVSSITNDEAAERKQRHSSSLLYNIGARWMWVANFLSLPLFSLEINPVAMVQEAGWAPLDFWMGVESLAPTGI